ncbi:MAG: ribonuclease III [Lachnospiraceae bacterium]|nr:ribonuclease III [Lachnospiraceae bacterium]
MEQGIDLLNEIKERFELSGADPGQYSPLALAFIGDSIYGAVAKTVVVLRGNAPANKLDREAVSIVKAVKQAKAADHLLENGLLTEEEEKIYRRGRNANSPTSAKNASMAEYRKATGLEALIGYLYLTGDMERVVELMHIIINN